MDSSSFCVPSVTGWPHIPEQAQVTRKQGKFTTYKPIITNTRFNDTIFNRILSIVFFKKTMSTNLPWSGRKVSLEVLLVDACLFRSVGLSCCFNQKQLGLHFLLDTVVTSEWLWKTAPWGATVSGPVWIVFRSTQILPAAGSLAILSKWVSSMKRAGSEWNLVNQFSI